VEQIRPSLGLIWSKVLRHPLHISCDIMFEFFMINKEMHKRLYDRETPKMFVFRDIFKFQTISSSIASERKLL